MQVVDEPELTPALIWDRYERLVARLRAAAEAAGRDPRGFKVIAVTKGFGVGAVRAAREAGLDAFGENRVQEAAAKVAAAPDADWHMIGRLQSNKVRQAIGLFGTVHSVDSIELLDRIERIAHDDARRPRLLLQVEMSGQEQRAGFRLDEFRALVADARGPLATAIGRLRAASVIGLMTIAPIDPGREGPHFAALRELRDRLQESCGTSLPELSMGMTSDAETAVREGATLVRVGTAIFGPRPEPH
jgi:PLP dependent protein